MRYILVTLGGAGTVKVSRPDKGRISNRPAKINWKTSPAQNTGIPTPTSEDKMIVDLTQRDRVDAATMPNGTPIVRVKQKAAIVSSSVAGKKSLSSFKTDWREVIDKPRSPDSSRCIYFRY
jgi:hypothetical protein